MSPLAKAPRAARPTGAEAEKQLAQFIAKFEPKHQALLRAVRRELRKRWPTANELVWDNYNFFVIGYSTTERPSDSIVAIAGGSNGVGLSFYRGSSLPDPHQILQGSGSQNRFIRLDSAAVLARREVQALLAAAAAQERPPLAKSGKGKLIIRSVSAKQRPRRRKAK